MNRQDFQTVLGQVDNVGDTLMRNRMNAEAKQERTADRDLRERMFTEQQATRKELQTQNAAWKTQSQDQQQLQTIIKANADGSLDDASREKANQWILQHPQLSATGIQLVKPTPKTSGSMEMTQVDGGRIAPNRTFIPDRLNPKEDYALKDLQEQLRDVRKQKATMEEKSPVGEFATSDPAEGNHSRKLRKLNEKEANLQTQVDAILNRFTGGATGKPGVASAPAANQAQDPDESEMPEDPAMPDQPQAQAAEVLPMPKSKADLVAGKTYQTSRGPATWNGEAFEQ